MSALIANPGKGTVRRDAAVLPVSKRFRPLPRAPDELARHGERASGSVEIDPPKCQQLRPAQTVAMKIVIGSTRSHSTQ